MTLADRRATVGESLATFLPEGLLLEPRTMGYSHRGTADTMNRLKILFFLSDEFPTHRPDVTSLFGKFLYREGIGTDLVARGRADASWPAGTLFLTPRSTGTTRTHLAALCGDLKALTCDWRGYDAILVRDKMLFAPLALLRARMANKPLFVWMSFPYPEWSKATAKGKRGLAEWMHRVRGTLGAWLTYCIVLPGADHLFVQSDTMRDGFATRGVARDRMTAVPMGIDPDRFADEPRQPSGQPRVIGYLGVFDRMRQVDVLVKALAELRSQGRDVVLRIVGDTTDPTERPRLDALIAAERLQDAITITGWIGPDEAIAAMADVEIALSVMPNDAIYSVGTPTKLVESLALGKAVIANTQPDHGQVLRESGAGLCVSLTAKGYAEAIASLLDDKERLTAMGAAGRRYVFERRNYATMAPALATVIRGLCRRR
jgi:glycosyltransferase involved in cell wall biosynthesis